LIYDERVERALKGAVAQGELGLQVAAFLGEDLIVDMHIGEADLVGTQVTPSTLFPIQSTGKAMLALVANLQAERGHLDLDAPIAHYWPEYASNGKGSITSRDVLSHRAGVPFMPATLTAERLDDWDWILSELEKMEPVYPRGARSQYHLISIYYLVGEVIRRTDPSTRMFDEILRDEVCAPLGLDDMWFRPPVALDGRIAQLTYGQTKPPNWAFGGDVEVFGRGVPPAQIPTPENLNLPSMRRTLSMNCYTTANDGAKFWALLANGGVFGSVRLLSPDTVLEFALPGGDLSEPDPATGVPMCAGRSGFQLGGFSPVVAPVVGTGPRVLCQTGGGGTVGWADIDTGLAVMYTHNRLTAGFDQFVALGEAVREVAEERT
jgi:CubicO group peptidase (beta-lactamase class C family)